VRVPSGKLVTLLVGLDTVDDPSGFCVGGGITVRTAVTTPWPDAPRLVTVETPLASGADVCTGLGNGIGTWTTAFTWPPTPIPPPTVGS